MTDRADFAGFPAECVTFFVNLQANNNRAWFEARRDDFERFVMAPARQFVLAMGERLREIAPGIHAEPRVDQSIFRIHRDTRFSKDKSPYKTHLGIWFWEGGRSKLDAPGFYFHLEPPNLMLGGGIYMFSEPLLSVYRDLVVHPRYGETLARAIHEVGDRSGYQIGGVHYKRVPRGYDPAHPNASLLLHNGLYIGSEEPIPAEFYSPAILDYCFKRYSDMLPIHRWLVELAA